MVVLLVVCFLLASVSVDARQLWPGVGHPPQECPTDEPPMGLPPSSSSETQCETPPKWISNIWYLDEYTGIMKAGRLFYDSDKQRIRKSVAILNIRENIFVDILLLFGEDRFYFRTGEIEENGYKTTQCLVSERLYQFQKKGVPSRAQCAYVEERGMGENTLTTTTYALVFNASDDSELGSLVKRPRINFNAHARHHPHGHGGHEHTWYGVFAPVEGGKCVPVIENIYEGNMLDYMRPELTNTVYTVRYTNFYDDVEDNMFDVPEECKFASVREATREEIEEKLQKYSSMYI